MIGKRLAQYEILEKIGEGGMGEVWLARDTALDREVAIKMLPELFGADGERLARFEREAKLLASLNHPGIAAVHGLHEQDGRRFLAMELVPGEDLGKRLEAGPLPVEQALFVAVQIAEALEAAHAQDVIHRDLKPANVMLTPEGKAKVLDFGLAKSSEASRSSSVSMSPTLTSGGTAAGTILGTAAYMSPEQARGKQVDRRTDIWSFGCVLLECLTGGNLFRGETVTDSLGAILHKEPDWAALPADTPPTVRLLLRRCLTKNPDKRLHDIADARIELAHAIEDPSGRTIGLGEAAIVTETGGRPGRVRPWMVVAAAAAALVVGILAGQAMREEAVEAPLRKLDLGVEIEAGRSEPSEVAISPDGTRIAFTHADGLWIQQLDTLDARLLEGTVGALAPIWSPEGEEIGYLAGEKLWRIPAIGGRPVAICDLGGPLVGGRGASWGEDGRIVLSRGGTGVLAVPALGGALTELVPLLEDEGDIHEPSVLPGGKGLLFVSHPSDLQPGILTLYHGTKRTELIHVEDHRLWSPVYAASGHVLFRRSGGEVTAGLWALPFSLDRMEATGEPFLVEPDAGAASVSRDGTLTFVHRPAVGGRDQLVWADRSGRTLEPIGGGRIGPSDPSLSPDGRFLAFGAVDAEDRNYDLWVRDLERGTESRLTVDKSFEFGFVWAPSGEELYFSHFKPPPEGPELVVFVAAADGSSPPRQLLDRGVFNSLTPDGRHYVASRLAEGEELRPDANVDLWLMPFAEDEEPKLLLGTSDPETQGTVSPNGRLMAYASERSGTEQVYVTRFPEMGRRWLVSPGAGDDPYWDPAGDRLYYVEDNTLTEVVVGPGDEPRLGQATALFDFPEFDQEQAYFPAGDGRFVIVIPAIDENENTARSGIKVVQNWHREFE